MKAGRISLILSQCVFFGESQTELYNRAVLAFAARLAALPMTSGVQGKSPLR